MGLKWHKIESLQNTLIRLHTMFDLNKKIFF